MNREPHTAPRSWNPGPPLNPAARWALAGLLLLAFGLRAWAGTWPGLRPDQLWSVEAARLPWGGLLRACAADTHPPLYYALLKLWFAVFPATLRSAQVMTALVSAGGVGLVFWLARGLFGLHAAWWAAACAALAPYLIFWGHVPRNHQLQPLACALVLGLSYRALAHAAQGRGWRGTWWGVAGAWCIALQTNYMGLVLGLAWGVAFLLLEPGAWRTRGALAASTLPGLLAFAPWVAIVRAQMHSGPAAVGFFQDPVSPAYLYFNSLFGAPVAYQPGGLGPRVLAGMAVFALVGWFAARRIGRRWSVWWLLLALPGLPIALAWGAGWTLANRHLAFALPLFLACWGAGAEAAWRALRRRVAALARGRAAG